MVTMKLTYIIIERGPSNYDAYCLEWDVKYLRSAERGYAKRFLAAAVMDEYARRLRNCVYWGYEPIELVEVEPS
jgi:hypothetical protein